MEYVLGFRWANSVIAFVGLAFGLPAPVAIMIFEERLRAKAQSGH